ncbi:Holliday junction branch migration protein RuvA [Knoellia subterranea]|uniref:Holliday junction branch migration complex subunit RuvA n=1 Tax=Knoellia subterranea KCTC 19937 TaxID=1385521 RepID=A0A0A0JRE3_9MICO|nr:Holliday junction branch migration protein RuvA [Knoellia subterranea]KGN38607.1 Holliday junction DNA helicase RuvA [Knoellia subterranea KCTC 19937]
MIASLTGRVGHVGLDRLVIEVGGVGMLVHTTPRTAAELRTGQEASVATTLVVREDSLTLFGFGSVAERDMFETVQTVSGVGPRLALAMLSVLTPDEVSAALRGGDLATLTKIPGVGKKSAERLVLELKDKVGMPSAPQGASATSAAAPSGDVRRDQVAEALVGLGWSAKQAGDAVAVVSKSADPDASVAALLRMALRELGR